MKSPELAQKGHNPDEKNPKPNGCYWGMSERWIAGLTDNQRQFVTALNQEALASQVNEKGKK